MDAKTFDWQRFLTRWSDEWAASRAESIDPDPASTGADDDARLGYPPATEADITALEQRLGRELPPSYREFLKVSDGWRYAGRFVWQVHGTAGAHWHEDGFGLGADFDAFWAEEGNPPEVRAQVGLWSRALQVDAESDAVFVLLDPEDVSADGEWAVRTWAGWRAEEPDRYPSFAHFMVAMHQEFHRFRISDEGATAFTDETTRTQDAAVDRARTAALRGRPAEAAELLDEAARYGRPGASDMLHQLNRLGQGRARGAQQPLPDHPRYVTELLPLYAAEVTRGGSGRVDHLADPEIFPDSAKTSGEILRAIREGSHRYRPGGAFGAAVDEAWEAARWGDDTEAWRILREALPRWEPLDRDHLAPVGLLADPVLGPVLTPERCAELLATPRGGERGPAPEPAAPGAPAGLSWPARAVAPGRQPFRTFRMVLVEGAAPDELPALLGGPGQAPLSPPLHGWDLRRHHHPGKSSFSSDEDPVLLRVGRAGEGWSFGFDGDPLSGFRADRFVSPALPASRDGRRAIVVWCDQRGDVPVFHLSLAEDGAERFAFTVRGPAVEDRRGDVPDGLAPERLGFGAPGPAGHVPAVLRALDALAELHGIGLPDAALTRGRLHSFEATPWIRPPRPDEPHATLTFIRHR
ncbi:SMI1/KNR4 family protein [Streptomyces sp. VRA16 Mangrove soil]|uniref:SMI1/KNR4 family protein n=1 Tax=Streptomyces sp. VRA16 Mangrove soil TaxID=2817434 RepID=UPI001AA00ABE|nr:SMI1/KNR4 family protein [Streptomyces sp. VRA16 Mangrove soil]MBO1336339.1 SMI1/KNR4 family protein [Streptomyces sp. VRA16 Mangrove soil]